MKAYRPLAFDSKYISGTDIGYAYVNHFYNGGLLLRSVWNQKKKFYKFANKDKLIKRTDAFLGPALTLFQDYYAPMISERFGEYFTCDYVTLFCVVVNEPTQNDRKFNVHQPFDVIPIDIATPGQKLSSPAVFEEVFQWLPKNTLIEKDEISKMLRHSYKVPFVIKTEKVVQRYASPLFYPSYNVGI